jgi:hypothetical protein
MTRQIASLAIAFVVLASACGFMPRATPNPGVPCEQVYSEGECHAMLDLWADLANHDRSDIQAVAILPNPTGPPGSTSGSAPPIRLRLTFKDGSTKETTVCGGVSMEPVCSAKPRASPT